VSAWILFFQSLALAALAVAIGLDSLREPK
jgi:hypothetical protein